MADYKIPGTLDVPHRIEAILIEDPEPTGPFGAKGIGEPGIIGVAPALANAIRDAAGIRLRRLPFLPERVLDALDGDGTDAGSAPMR
jgi:CO/xanthine dehydrogenase Mo-binding subunit